ncbi:MAG: hypothetical protein JOZ16_01300 [Methylobacteriaceae bacterium]|nr:hypothetical protein [Methylobacteriaceae bacterium]
MFVRPDLTFDRLAIRAEARRRFTAKGRFAAAHGGFPRFLRDAFAVAKRVRADMAAAGPQRRAREDAEKEARYAAILKSRTDADRARSDELIGLLCSTDGRLPATTAARMRTLNQGGARP